MRETRNHATRRLGQLSPLETLVLDEKRRHGTMCNMWETTPDFDVVSNGKRYLEKVKMPKHNKPNPDLWLSASQEHALKRRYL